MTDKARPLEASILVVDDDPAFRQTLGQFLARSSHRHREAVDLESARRRLEEQAFDVVFLDVNLPDGNGLDLLRTQRPRHPRTSFIVMTGEGEVEIAVQAMKDGARDFLLKPFGLLDFRRALQAALERRTSTSAGRPGKELVGQSAPVRATWDLIDLYAPTDIGILLLGESGTGKEMFARAVHVRSKRATGPFIELDGASLPESLIEAELFGHEKGAFTDAARERPGRFELASGGTIFLDEIGNLTPAVQAKLLRILQERCFRRIGGTQLVEVDVRIVAATNQDLEAAVRAGTFRSDLYYRLAEMTIVLPPLRSRAGDVALLAEHFVREYARKFDIPLEGLDPEALAQLEAYAWPGNVRELENVVRSACVPATGRIRTRDLPAHLQGGRSRSSAPDEALVRAEVSTDRLQLEIPLDLGGGDLDLKALGADVRTAVEKAVLERLVRARKLNKAQLARFLHLDYKTLHEKLKLYSLDPSAD